MKKHKMKKWIILLFIIIFLPSVFSIKYGEGKYGKNLYGASSPNITIISPSNNSVVILTSLSESVSFVFSVNKNSSICKLFFDDVNIGTSTNSLNTTTITKPVTNFGTFMWFVNCTESINSVIGKSDIFILRVEKASTTGGGPSQSSPSGSGGFPTSELTAEPSYTYTLGYICNRTNEFIDLRMKNGNFIGYNNSEIGLHQLKITKELGYSISERTLREYIDYSESYCNISKKSFILKNVFSTEDELFNFSLKPLNYTLLYIPIQLKIMKIHPSLFKFLSVLFKIEYKQNSYYLTKLYIFPLFFITFIILIIAFYKKIIAYSTLFCKYILSRINYYKKYIISLPSYNYMLNKLGYYKKYKKYLVIKISKLEEKEIK